MAQLITRGLLVALFLAAGSVHLFNPKVFLPAMPPFIPFPLACILLSGVVELAAAAALLMPGREFQRLTGWLLILFLIAIFPVNLYMAMGNVRLAGLPPHSWVWWARLPLQPLLMLAVAWVTGLFPTR